VSGQSSVKFRFLTKIEELVLVLAKSGK